MLQLKYKQHCDGLPNSFKLRTVSASYLKLVCLLSTSAYSALEVLHIIRYINLLTYLLTYIDEDKFCFCCSSEFAVECRCCVRI